MLAALFRDEADNQKADDRQRDERLSRCKLVVNH